VILDQAEQAHERDPGIVGLDLIRVGCVGEQDCEPLSPGHTGSQ
jgi:hypothetical protein